MTPPICMPHAEAGKRLTFSRELIVSVTFMKLPTTRWQHMLLVGSILLLALNLRPAVTVLSPLAERMRADGLSRETIGAMTTMPLILFGVAGMWAGWIGGRFGLARSLGVGLLLLSLGCFLRSMSDLDHQGARFAGTVLIGAGIALGNVLLPGLVKSRYPDKVGLLTSLYSTAMNLGAALGIAIAVPLANRLAGGWNASIASWGVFALATVLLWIPQMLARPAVHRPSHPLAGVIVLARQKRAWQVAIFMGLQSSVFYSAVAWLPTVLQVRGMSEAEAAGWVTAMQILGCVASLLVPTLAGRLHSQSGWIVTTAILNGASLAGLLLLPKAAIGVAVIGFGLGVNASFGLALLVIALRSRDSETAANLSSLAQAAGYLIAAPGPWLVGWMSETTGSWTLAVGLVIVIALGAAVFGWKAGRPGELSLVEGASRPETEG